MRAVLCSVALCLSAAACGARSDLRLPPTAEDASGGSAGATSGPGGQGGSAGGAGGGAPCDELVTSEPLVSVAGGEGFHQRHPVLTYSSDDRTRVTVASNWFVVEGPGLIPTELRHTSFRPWGASWPADGTIEPTYLADFDAGASFAAAPSVGDRLALLMWSPQEGTRFSLEFVPESGAVPTKHPVDFSDRVLFASQRVEPSTGAAEHLLGTELPTFPRSTAFSVATELDGGVAIEGPMSFACASDPMSADAVVVDGGFLIASSTSARGLGGPCLDPGPTGPADLLLLEQVVNGVPASINALAIAPLARVRLAPHPEGAWVAWSTTSGLAEAARLDPFGSFVHGPFPLVGLDETAIPDSLAAGHLGDRLVIAFARQRTDNPNDLVVRVYEPDGELLFDTGMQPLAMEADPISLLGSPDGDAFVVAYSESTTEGARIRLTRFECR